MDDSFLPKLSTCKNCHNSFEGIVCNLCGQKLKIYPTSPKGMLMEWWHARKNDFFHFLFTTRELILRPGQVLDEYLSGKRKKYYNSTNYFLLVASLVTFITLEFREVDAVQAVEKWNKIYESMGVPMPDRNPGGIMVFEWISTHYNVAMMLTLPFLALASFLTFRYLFKNRSYKFGDHFVMHLFIYGLNSLILMPTIPFANPGNPESMAMMLTSICLVLLYGWVYKSWYKMGWGRAILASIVAYLLYFILFFLFIIGLVIVAIILIFLVIAVLKLFR